MIIGVKKRRATGVVALQKMLKKSGVLFNENFLSDFHFTILQAKQIDP